MNIPTLDQVITQMETVSGASSINPDDSVLDTGDVDSLDMMEWLYELQENYPDLGASEHIIEGMNEATTFRTIYDALLSALKTSAGA